MFYRWRLAAREKLQRAVREVIDDRLADHEIARRADAAQQAEAAGQLGDQLDELAVTLRSELATLRDATHKVEEHIAAFEQRQRRDLGHALDLWATTTTAAFIAHEMPAARTFDHPHDTLRWALTQAPPTGLALEFGVWSGTTLQIIAAARPRGTVFGFDSFQGLPETWRTGFESGTFSTEEPPEVPGADLVVGLFEDRLPGWTAEHPESVAFLHVDADLYSSTTTVLEHVGDRLVEGSIVVFDEYFNYPGWPDHEHRAWTEFVARTGTSFTYEAYTRDNEQVAVRITKPGSPDR